jgi:hypothetical protein
MLFRNNNGELIEIKKYDYSNDKLYFQKLINIKKNKLIPIKDVFFNKEKNFLN